MIAAETYFAEGGEPLRPACGILDRSGGQIPAYHHSIPAISVIDAGCRLCISNDDEALIEHLAEKLWDSRIDRTEGPLPWDQAGVTWQAAFRELAVAARQALATECLRLTLQYGTIKISSAGGLSKR